LKTLCSVLPPFRFTLHYPTPISEHTDSTFSDELEIRADIDIGDINRDGGDIEKENTEDHKEADDVDDD
jgi:hypothetical protein